MASFVDRRHDCLVNIPLQSRRHRIVKMLDPGSDGKTSDIKTKRSIETAPPLSKRSKIDICHFPKRRLNISHNNGFGKVSARFHTGSDVIMSETEYDIGRDKEDLIDYLISIVPESFEEEVYFITRTDEVVSHSKMMENDLELKLYGRFIQYGHKNTLLRICS